ALLLGQSRELSIGDRRSLRIRIDARGAPIARARVPRMSVAVSAPRIEGYEIVAKVGEGGMGEVWEAVRVGPAGFRKSVAIKQLALENAIDRLAVQRFLQEARISARLDHPNIVRVHDLLVLDRHYLVMELLRGRSIADAIKRLNALDERPPWWL